MKTIFEKVPIKISSGQTVTMQLPEPFYIKDSMFLLVHNSLNEILKVTISNANGHSMTKNVTLDSFPTIIVFSECTDTENLFLNELGYFSVSFTSFNDFEGGLSFRVRNPAHIIATYRDSQSGN